MKIGKITPSLKTAHSLSKELNNLSKCGANAKLLLLKLLLRLSCNRKVDFSCV